MLNLITPKKLKKKYCAEMEEEDLAPRVQVRKGQDRMNDVEECLEMSSLPRVQEDKEVEVSKSDGAKCTNLPIQEDKEVEVEVGKSDEAKCKEVLRTKHVKCPSCGGNVMTCNYRSDKGEMTVYGLEGVRHVVHRESRCQDCRMGLFYGYRVLKGGKKIFEKDALRNQCLVVSNVTAFDVDFCFRQDTFEGLADEFNDIHCKDYDSVDEQRLKLNNQRVADAFYAFTFLELNERWGFEVELDGSKKDVDNAILAHMALYRCHLKPYAEKEENQMGPKGKQFASKLMAVDKLHFRGHRGKYCQEFCDPWKLKELDGVNTPVCEQTFAWMNRFTQCRGMNEARFFWFFMYIIDLRNNAREKKLRVLLDPACAERKKYCDSIPKINLSSTDSSREQAGPIHPLEPYMEMEDGTFSCSYCAKVYKQLASLKKHLEKNHALVNAVTFSCALCRKCFETKFQLTRHNKKCK